MPKFPKKGANPSTPTITGKAGTGWLSVDDGVDDVVVDGDGVVVGCDVDCVDVDCDGVVDVDVVDVGVACGGVVVDVVVVDVVGVV